MKTLLAPPNTLHHINLKLYFVSGQVVVGVRRMLPVEYILFSFCIDLAGGNVILDPIVSEEPSYGENELENTGVLPACAVNLAMKKPLEENETLLQDGTIATSEVEL